MAKWWCTDLQGRVVDRCLQLHGGYGYMLEYPIARAYADARVTRIYGGANEIMKEIVGRDPWGCSHGHCDCDYDREDSRSGFAPAGWRSAASRTK